MKNLVLAIIGLVSIVVLGSCSGYDIEDMQPQQDPNTNTNNNDEKKDNDDKWENILDDWYEMINDYKTIDSYKKTNLKEYNAQAPFSVSLGDSIYFTTEDKNKSSFGKLHSVDPRNTSYGEWYSNAENDSLRSVTTTQLYECSQYNRNVTVINAQAFRYINGGREAFEMPTIVISFAGHQSDFEAEKLERNDSLFIRENIKDSVKVAFGNRPDIKPFYVSAKTTIDHFSGMKEKDEAMPEPTFWVEGEILYISSRTASPIYKNYSKKDQGADWFEVNVIHTTVKTYTVANGQLKDSYDNSELADATWNSCVYDAGYTNKWVPCTLTPNNGGWVYTLQFADGTYRGMDIPMNQACIDGLKSFQKDNNAAQTPFLDSAAAVKKSYSNGVLWAVNSNGLYSYTVAGK